MRLLPSRLAVASQWPSGLHATRYTAAVWPASVNGSSSARLSPATVQSLTVRSTLDEARRRPSGLKATPKLLPPCDRATSCRPEGTSHSRTRPSLPVVASSRPSGLNATPLTSVVRLSRVTSGVPDAASHTMVVPAAPPPARRVPSGLNRTLCRKAGYSRLSCGCPAPVSATVMVVPPGLAASRVPSALQDTPPSPGLGPGLVSTNRPWPVAASQTRTVPSLLALASCVPSGLKVTLLTSLACPCRVSRLCPVPASHTRTVWSSPAVARRDPSGLNATSETRPVWPTSVGPSPPPVGETSH